MKKYLDAYPGFWLPLVLLLAGCAQMAEPTGGEKDIAAPEIISDRTVPRNGTVNFNSEQVVITFSEYIQVKNQNVVITPALPKKPTIRAKGKKLEITFESELAANTTYTVNLSGAVNDITEANLTQNLQYVFSTGPYLDSLGISGKVVNAFSLNGVSGTTVILQPAEQDSAIYKSKPAYFTKTEKDGIFNFYHLKQGMYRIYAVNDQNSDLLYGGYPEDIAFTDTVITLDTNVRNLVMKQFKPEEKKIYMRSTANISKFVQVFRFNKLIPDIGATPLNSNDTTLKFYAYNNSDSVFYMSLHDTTRTDTIRFGLRSGDTIIDTLNFIAHLSRKTSSKTGFRISVPQELYITDSILITAGTNLRFDRDKITLTDTLHKKPVNFTIKNVFNGVSIVPEEQTEKIPIKVVCLPGAFTSMITYHTNDTLKGVTTVLPREKMGSVKLTFKGLSEKNMVSPVSVLMLDNKPVKKTRIDLNRPVLEAENLKPGNYSVYLFDDLNSDFEWSPGNFEYRVQPENVIRYNQSIKVKANWDQDLTWVL